MSKITFNAVEADYIYAWFFRKIPGRVVSENETKLVVKIQDYIAGETKKEVERNARNKRNTNGSYR